ncbi:MAG: hypothetical protein N3A72_02490 [bacterium]|nr:hypothetical protein [bacterium]
MNLSGDISIATKSIDMQNHIRIILIVSSCFFAYQAKSWPAIFTVSDLPAFQSALNTAAVNGEPDTINISAGIYNLTSPLRYNSTENYSLTISGAGIGVTILDGRNTTQILNLLATGSSGNITIRRISCTNGTSTAEGGGIRIETGASATVENAELTYNSASTLGGGLHILSNFGTISVMSCSFRNNSAGLNGGGLNAGSTDGTILLAHNTFTGNIIPGVHTVEPAYDGGGAMLYIDGVGQVIVTRNTFICNTAADDAGGCMTYANSSGVTININHNIFSHNVSQLGGAGCFTRMNETEARVAYTNNYFSANSTVTGDGAGTLIHLNDGSLTFSGNTYLNNCATGDGGGVSIWNGTGKLVLSSNIFQGNRTLNNGGGMVLATDFGTITCIRNIFNTNTAINIGGGLSYAATSGKLELNNNTFYQNTATEGSGVYLYFDRTGARANIVNNIFWRDSDPAIAMSGATSAIARYCDIENGIGQPWFGTGCIAQNPLFKNPANGNFNLTWTNYPASDTTKSPCIDTGDPTTSLDPDGTRADIGAFYFDQSALTTIDPLRWIYFD